MLSAKEMKSMKKEELVRLLLQSQENSLLVMSKLEESKCNIISTASSPIIECNNDYISFPTLKSFLSKAIMELKEELTLDFNRRVETLSAKVLALHDGIASLKREAEASREKLKSDFLSEMRDQEVRRKNLMIFGASESLSASSGDVRENDKHCLSLLSATLDLPMSNIRSFFRLGSRRHGNNSRPRPIKVVFETELGRDDFLHAAQSLRKHDTGGSFRGVFVKPDLSPREQEIDKNLRDELRARKERGERVIIRRGKIVPVSSSNSAPSDTAGTDN